MHGPELCLNILCQAVLCHHGRRISEFPRTAAPIFSWVQIQACSAAASHSGHGRLKAAEASAPSSRLNVENMKILSRRPKIVNQNLFLAPKDLPRHFLGKLCKCLWLVSTALEAKFRKGGTWYRSIP